MIFNKDNNGAEELRLATSSYYANNDYSRIQSTVYLVERELADVLGNDVWADITGRYEGTNQTGEGHEHDQELVLLAQRAVGLMATMRYSRLNDLSHEDDGRKAKIDRENEARPFEWQLARDERVHLEEYYATLNALIALLETTENAAWIDSRCRKQSALLLLPNSLVMSEATGISFTPWLYFRLIPYLSEAQHWVMRAYGRDFSELLQWSRDLLKIVNDDNDETNEEEKELREEAVVAARRAEGLKALAIMAGRTEVSALPWGLMGAITRAGGDDQEHSATIDQLHHFARHQEGSAAYWLNEMKHLRDKLHEQEDGCTMLQTPENRPENKYFLT